MSKNPRLIDLSGQRFGDLKVIEQAGNSPGGGALWRCVCVCGKETNPLGQDLRKGKVKSCGHGKRQQLRDRMSTHRQTGTRLYRIWKAMRTRCNNPNYPGYKDYGGRGISICAEWNDFTAFAKWARRTGYSNHLTIERIDNDQGYKPSNCRWATVYEQAINKRNVPIASDGRPWWHIARDNGISLSAYRTRIYNGWPLEQAATWPMFKKRRP